MSKRLLQRQNKLAERCQTLAEIVSRISPLYTNASITANQRHFIETIVGAAIWYLPAASDSWTGRISVAAVRSYHPDLGDASPKLTADHEYPRKVSAAELLKKDWSTDAATDLLRLYAEKLGKYNYVTPYENKLLVRYQKSSTFRDPAAAYKEAGIELVTISADELVKIKARDRATIEVVLGRTAGQGSHTDPRPQDPHAGIPD